MTQSNGMAQSVAFSHNVNFSGEALHNLWQTDLVKEKLNI